MKKILSLILALSLIISVAPMSFATGAEDAANDGMHFNFSAANWNENATDDIYAAEIKANGDANVNGGTPAFASANTDPWYIDGHYGINDYRLTSGTPDETYPNAKPNALYWSVMGKYLNPVSTNGKASAALALRVTIKETGVFTPSVTYEGGPTSTNYGFFLAPVSAYTNGYTFASANILNKAPLSGCFWDNNRKSNLVFLGEENFYESEKDEEKETAYFHPVHIEEPGDYYLYIAPNGVVDNKPAYDYRTDKETLYDVNLYSVDFTPCSAEDAATAAASTAKEDTTYTEAPEKASVKTLALYGEISAVIGKVDVTYGESTEIPAVDKTYTDEETGDTYNFLYWAKGLDNGDGNKHIISTSNGEFSYKPHEGNNYLIAVYEKEGAEKEAAFYDRNGQLLNLEITDSKLPALPAMAGLGDAIGWEQLGTGELFAAGDDVSALEGDKVFMAKYNDELSENIAISINGFSDTYAYGDLVTCEIASDKAEDFSYWIKAINGKQHIVSLDETYTFNAWKDCTVTAVYGGKVDKEKLGVAARKIILSTFSAGENLTAVMAEFIGFDDAKEKGIMFDGKKIAMTTDYAQFTVTNDTTKRVTVTGYAIVDNTKYVDGEVTVAAAK